MYRTKPNNFQIQTKNAETIIFRIFVLTVGDTVRGYFFGDMGSCRAVPDDRILANFPPKKKEILRKEH